MFLVFTTRLLFFIYNVICVIKWLLNTVYFLYFITKHNICKGWDTNSTSLLLFSMYRKLIVYLIVNTNYVFQLSFSSINKSFI